MEQILILALLALISFVNWLFQRSAELRKQREIERRRAGRTGEHSYQEPVPVPESTHREVLPPAAPDPAAEMRRLMEALGLPVEDEPPVRQPEPVTFREFPPEPPPLPAPEPVVIRQSPPRERASRGAEKPAEPTPARLSKLRESLASRDEIRRAILLREILGPPKADTLG